jgi:protein-S-isoprenylcysteine O-methyltransferase Ste14
MPVIATRGSVTGHLFPIIGAVSRPFIPPPFSHRAFAAIGGLVFVASLAVFAVCYTVRYGVEDRMNAASGLLAPVVVNCLLFSVFALHHSIFARSGLKARLVRVVPPDLERSTYVWLASLLFLAVCLWWRPVPGTWWQLDGIWRWLALAVQSVAGVATLISAGKLDVLRLAGVRQTLGSGAEQPLVRRAGGYGLVRHPIYLEWCLFVWSAPTMTATRAVFAIISTFYLMVAVPFEERDLRRLYGQDYETYTTKVRWRMIPFVY